MVIWKADLKADVSVFSVNKWKGMWLRKLEATVVIVKWEMPAQNVKTQERHSTNENIRYQCTGVEINSMVDVNERKKDSGNPESENLYEQSLKGSRKINKRSLVLR